MTPENGYPVSAPISTPLSPVKNPPVTRLPKGNGEWGGGTPYAPRYPGGAPLKRGPLRVTGGFPIPMPVTLSANGAQPKRCVK